ncbi:Acylphosphatase-domain-containing protein [Naematelia encephala]|uniref:acylphosphatase n=1 Tax=Naematelia encephala TaxID=71784 RepID=A0A1Y2BCQ4_9TREE|nr:Acylphosphatase-domain-containing protein [Naematelia encephala]
MVDLIQFKVTGSVQGVSFRYATQKEAQKLGLKGWCRNHPDSSVEGAAVGPSDKIQQFHQFLHRGPSAAEVERVELITEKRNISEQEADKALGGRLSGFEVRR